MARLGIDAHIRGRPIVYEEEICSTTNLGGVIEFLTFKATREECAVVLRYTFVVNHRGPVGFQVPPVMINRADGSLQLEDFPCIQSPCRRCEKRIGGYQYRFTHPCWSVKAWQRTPQLRREIEARRARADADEEEKSASDAEQLPSAVSAPECG